MAFWSIVLPGKGKEVEQEVESSETVLSSIHVTTLALGATPAKGPHVVSIEYNGTHTVLATLEAPHTRQFRLDIALDQTFKMINHGDSPVYAYGYQVATSNHIEDMSADEEDEDEEDDEYDMEEGEDEDDEDDEDEEEDDERPPKAVPLANGGKGKQLRAQRRDADDDEEEGEDEDEDDDEGEADGIPDYKDLNSDDFVAVNQGEDEDEDEAGEEEDEEEDDEDEDEQMEEPEARPPAKVGGKRPAPAQTPQPAKAQRGGMKAEPKSAPPKQQAGGPRQIPVTTPAPAQKGGKEAKGAATPGNEAEFRQALVTMLKSAKNPVPLAVLGHAVQRPSAMKGRDFKLGSYLEKNSDLFEYEPKKGLVSLRKGGGGKK
ncbi:hypothetical protein HYH02_008536 [Chlamydomonas schloesseri]|uniref:Nucleoplasmin-like domain-containing protein n=1 Tax=Chlamydomonas schloesseri TaxID=2026947 RepID=A0A835WFH2_9CHLO|nr:hypothetical protein HYH02_008536 [Chlamydomonas schloesseri]|eukprot:KAG2446549.1 hypothetical protein HYH02_008536 [Chlamydomonas schloesseri]